MLGAVIAGLFLGFLAGGLFFARPLRRKVIGVSFRPLREVGGPYRESPSAEAAVTMSEIVTAARNARLNVHVKRSGFDLRDSQGRFLRVRTLAVGALTLASLDITDECSDPGPFDLALALVPVFGPMVVTMANFGKYVVDVQSSREGLCEQQAERIRQIANGVLEQSAERRASLTIIGNIQ